MTGIFPTAGIAFNVQITVWWFSIFTLMSMTAKNIPIQKFIYNLDVLEMISPPSPLATSDSSGENNNNSVVFWPRGK